MTLLILGETEIFVVFHRTLQNTFFHLVYLPTKKMFTPKCFFRIFVLQNVFCAIFALHSHILHDVDTYIVVEFFNW